MKNLNNIIKEVKIFNEFVEIDSNIICESLQCKLLQDLAKQLLDIKAQNQKDIDDEFKKDEERGWSSTWKRSNNSKVFKEIFGRVDIEWDKVTDGDISKIPASDEPDKNQDKQIRDVLKGKTKYLILVKDKEDKKFLYYIDNWTYLWQLIKRGYNSLPGDRLHNYVGRQTKDLTQAEKISYCRGKNIYFIDYAKYQKGAQDKQIDRRNARSGMILLDPDSLRRLAEDNVKRYKEIIRKNKANNLNNDKLLNEAKKIIQQAATYATIVAKDPIRHADLIRDVSKLSTWIYDRRRYVSGNSPKYPGYYTGVDGLLPAMMDYTKIVPDLAKNGGYDFQQKELNNAQEHMKKAIEECKKMIEEIEKKLDI